LVVPGDGVGLDTARMVKHSSSLSCRMFRGRSPYKNRVGLPIVGSNKSTPWHPNDGYQLLRCNLLLKGTFEVVQCQDYTICSDLNFMQVFQSK